jgi:hypothetical protein
MLIDQDASTDPTELEPRHEHDVKLHGCPPHTSA